MEKNASNKGKNLHQIFTKKLIVVVFEETLAECNREGFELLPSDCSVLKLQL